MTSSERAIEERVREALSEPITPAQVAALDARLERGRTRRVPFLQGRALRRSMLLVAAVAIAVPLAVAAGMMPGSDEVPPPADLENGVSGLFSEDACVGPEKAEQRINALLADLGYGGWKVGYAPGAQTSECVVAGLDGQTRTITLYMALTPEVNDGLAAVREQLYSECLTRGDAVARIDQVLRNGGVEGYRIESGPLSAPSDRVDEIERHVANGCWVYSTTGWTADGTRVFWIAGE